MILGKIIHISVNWENVYKTEQWIICIFGVNLRIILRKKWFEGMIYVSTTNVQGFIYYFGIFYLKIGKFYTFFQFRLSEKMAMTSSITLPVNSRVQTQ